MNKDQARAARLYPDNPYLQREWLRAVGVVRRTKRGWQLERPVVPPPTERSVLAH